MHKTSQNLLATFFSCLFFFISLFMFPGPAGAYLPHKASQQEQPQGNIPFASSFPQPSRCTEQLAPMRVPATLPTAPPCVTGLALSPTQKLYTSPNSGRRLLEHCLEATWQTGRSHLQPPWAPLFQAVARRSEEHVFPLVSPPPTFKLNVPVTLGDCAHARRANSSA